MQTSLLAGYITSDSYDSGTVSPELQAYAERLADVWRTRIEAEVRAMVVDYGLSALAQSPPQMDVLKLLEFAYEHGPPPPPPVPMFDDFERGASLLEAPSPADEAWVEERFRSFSAAPFATLRLGGWLLVFGADRSMPAHYVSEIYLREDGSDDFVQVLLTDVWNPVARWSVDGDAFVFRRFIQWLRGVLEAAGFDDTYTFEPDECDDDDEPSVLTLQQWLLFDEKGDDEDMLDWRCENYIVMANRPPIDAAGIFGFDGATTKRLEEGGDIAIVTV